jgi:hypothetical protein
VREQWEKLAWIALAILLVAAGCGSSAIQSPPTSTPTPVPPTQPSAPTPALPTQTPAPTPVPPTRTPAPTATAEALPFPVDGIFAKGSLTGEFKPDGTYITEGHTQLMNAKYNGTYTVTGDQVAFQDDYVPCRDVVGTYAWTYDGEVLAITKVEDECRDRAGMAWGNWRKKPASLRAAPIGWQCGGLCAALDGTGPRQRASFVTCRRSCRDQIDLSSRAPADWLRARGKQSPGN